MDTIANLSTALGPSAINVIKISGPYSKILIKNILKKDKKNIKIIKNRHLYYTKMYSKSSDVIDDITIYYLKGPGTYTGENEVEILCHGGNVIQKMILARLLEYKNIRLSKNGEFTKRAFLNNKIDLIQACSIKEIIEAENYKDLKIAQYGLYGKFSNDILDLKKGIIEIVSYIEAIIDYGEDFSENEVEDVIQSLKARMAEAKNKIKKLIKKRISIKSDFVKVVITGDANVGKSTLFNRLINKDRSIVDEEKGTTRDYVEETIKKKNYSFNIVDTAGLEEVKGNITKKAIEKTNELIRQADILINVKNIKEYNSKENWLKNSIKILNKVDNVELVGNKKNIFYVSAKYNYGIEELLEIINKKIKKLYKRDSQNILAENIEKNNKLKIIYKKIIEAECICECDNDFGILSYILKEILEHIDIITGKISNEDILDNIFSNFCIGK